MTKSTATVPDPNADSSEIPPGTSAADEPQTPDAPAEPPRAAPPTAGQSRFQTCRWRKPADAGTAAYCTHRDVLPMAGTSGFNPDSWCPDCAFYKLRRVPRREY